MKYIIRVIKYFVYICLITTLMLAVLVAFGLISSDINVMFNDGYGSIAKIALMFFCVACFYPKFGFAKRGALIPGEYGEIRDKVVSFMENHGYEVESEEGENISFRLRSGMKRAFKMWEDRLVFTRDMAGFYIEGINRDVVKIKNGLEFLFATPEED